MTISNWEVCERCGAVIAAPDEHQTFHEQLAAHLDTGADEAQEED